MFPLWIVLLLQVVDVDMCEKKGCPSLGNYRSTFRSSQWRFQVNSTKVSTFQTSKKSRVLGRHDRYKVRLLEEGYSHR